MSIYYGGTVERDRYGYVEFVEIQSVSVLFNEKPSFSEFVARAREELHCHGADDDDDILKASGFSSIAAFARRARSSFFSLSSLYAATRLLSSLSTKDAR